MTNTTGTDDTAWMGWVFVPSFFALLLYVTLVLYAWPYARPIFPFGLLLFLLLPPIFPFFGVYLLILVLTAPVRPPVVLVQTPPPVRRVYFVPTRHSAQRTAV